MTHANQLLARLGPHDRQSLLAIGETVRLLPGVVLFERGEDAPSVFFPTAGAVVLTVGSPPAGDLGVVLVGSEGMLGMHRVLGSELSTMRAVAQTPGSAMRVSAHMFSQAMNNSHTLRAAMLSYVGKVVNQVAAATACTRCHFVGPRLAGWLLMSRDREGTDRLHLTHEALARTLGVRRVGITEAAQELQRLQLIDYRRGDITIIDVAGLRAVAGHSYWDGPRACASIRNANRQARSASGQRTLAKVVDPLDTLRTR